MNQTHFVKALGTFLTASVWALSAQAQIFVDANGNASEYTMDGNLVNASVLPGVNVTSITSDGAENLFVIGNGSLGAYTVDGTSLWQYPNFRDGGAIFDPLALAYSDGNLFVEDNEAQDPYSPNPSEFLWTLNATTGNGATLAGSGFQNMTGGLAASGNNWYFSVFNGYAGGIDSSLGTIASGIYDPQNLALDGQGHLFVVSYPDGAPGGAVAEYDASTGQLLNSALISVNDPGYLAVIGNDLFVSYDENSAIAEYTTSGQVVNAALITGLSNVSGFTVVPEHSTLAIVLFGSCLCICTSKQRWLRHKKRSYKH